MANGQAACDLAMSRLNKNQYTQGPSRTRVFQGYSDCSSLVWKCFDKAYGIYVGSWTGEQVDRGRLVLKRSSAVPYAKLTQSDLNKMQPGDCIFYGSGYADHVEIYLGGTRQIGHGSGIGPTIKNALEYGHPSGVYQVRRYVADDTTKPASAEKEKRIFVGKVTALELNVRSWYGKDENGAYYPNIISYPILKKGNLVDVLNSYEYEKAKWYKVKIADKFVGFVHGDYIERA